MIDPRESPQSPQSLKEDERPRRRAHVYFVFHPSERMTADGFDCIYIHESAPDVTCATAAVNLVPEPLLFGARHRAALA